MNSSTDSRAPDETPVQREHVEAFLSWYGQRVKLPRYTGFDEHWFNALHTLNLGELRNGISAIAQHDPPAYLEPTRFWSVCKGKVKFATAIETQRLRGAVKGNYNRRRG